jgi:hypothetical protein
VVAITVAEAAVVAADITAIAAVVAVDITVIKRVFNQVIIL